MNTTRLHTLRSFVVGAAAATLAACAERTPLQPMRPDSVQASFARAPAGDTDGALVTLQRVTARYHDIDAAFADGFVLLHGCENRPGEGPVGAVYVHFGRLMDGAIDPQAPDALIYEPTRNGRLRLVGVEFALPYSLWNQPQPPTFLGATFQTEDEFGVFALHVWVWRNNPEGLFAESNPRVTCDAIE
ncbi:MAG TPA: hypothetical protein VFZ21_20095 [Gemmatimonadaceae bacterium]|jgi:hypothetical protein|nr:hypothetical protein [Gemmatimonadaceae bacterium]